MRESIVEKKLVTYEQTQEIRDALKLIEEHLPNFFSNYFSRLDLEENCKKDVKKQFEKCILTIKNYLESKELTVNQLYKVNSLMDSQRNLLNSVLKNVSKNISKPEGIDSHILYQLFVKLNKFRLLVDASCAYAKPLRSPLLVSEIKIESYARRFIKFVMAILESIKNFLCGIIYYKNSTSVGSEEKCSGLQADITPVQAMQRDYYGSQPDTSQHNRPDSR